MELGEGFERQAVAKAFPPLLSPQSSALGTQSCNSLAHASELSNRAALIVRTTPTTTMSSDVPT